MKELNLKLEVPDEYAQEAQRLANAIIAEDLMLKSLEQCAKVELQKRLLKTISSKSKLSEKKAYELSELIKEGVAKRHGL